MRVIVLNFLLFVFVDLVEVLVVENLVVSFFFLINSFIRLNFGIVIFSLSLVVNVMFLIDVVSVWNFLDGFGFI